MTERDEPPLLTFQWRERERRGFMLIFYILVSIAGAILFFMLFKVVYPQAEHLSVSPHHVILLDQSDPAARDLINRTRDANFLLLGQANRQPATVPGAKSLFPVFEPSFKGYEMKLVDLPIELDKQTLPRLYTIRDIPLPPLTTISKPGPADTPRPTTKPPKATLLVLGDLEKRQISGLDAGQGVTLTDPTPVRFSIGVSESGQVTAIVPLWASSEGRQFRLMHRAISRLRFRPSPGRPIEWGEVSFQWSQPQ